MTVFRKRWQSRQLHPGTRIIHYRCCLPALAGFANYRRERTNGTAIERGGSIPPAAIPLRNSNGGEGGIRTREAGISRLHTFQACSFNRSDTSPHVQTHYRSCRAGYARLILRLALRAARYGPACGCPDSLPANLSNPRSGYKPLTHNPGRTFQACSFNRSDTSPHVDHANSISKRIALARAGEDTGRDQPAQEWGMPQYLNQHATSA